MNLIYMEITHNTDDSARDLSSLDEGEEMKNKIREGWRFLPRPNLVAAVDIFLPPTSLLSKHILWRFGSRMFGLGITPSACICVFDGEHVCELLSLCNPAELRPTSLVPSDPSNCLIAWWKAISLKQHKTLAVSCCPSTVLCLFFTYHGCVGLDSQIAAMLWPSTSNICW